MLISEREIWQKFILQRAKRLIFFRQIKNYTLLSHMFLESPSPNAAIAMAGIKANLFRLNVWLIFVRTFIHDALDDEDVGCCLTNENSS